MLSTSYRYNLGNPGRRRLSTSWVDTFRRHATIESIFPRAEKVASRPHWNCAFNDDGASLLCIAKHGPQGGNDKVKVDRAILTNWRGDCHKVMCPSYKVCCLRSKFDFFGQGIERSILFQFVDAALRCIKTNAIKDASKILKKGFPHETNANHTYTDIHVCDHVFKRE